jgi:hypothetical protein
MDWSLDRELLLMAGASNQLQALVRLGICDETCERCSLETRNDWERSGAETFRLIAEVIHDSGKPSTLIFLKACVALGGLQGVGAIVDEWVSKRWRLEEAGISVPLLYGTISGTIWEEFIPYSLLEVLQRAKSAVRVRLVRSLGFTMGMLTKMGVPALDVSDWRSHGSDVVLVDFGEDLGPIGIVQRKTPHILDEWLRLLKPRGIVLTSAELELLSEQYDRALAP